MEFLKKWFWFLFETVPTEEVRTPWPSGAASVSVQIVSPLVMQTSQKSKGPWASVPAGKYTVSNKMGMYTLVARSTECFADEAYWQKMVEAGRVKVL